MWTSIVLVFGLLALASYGSCQSRDKLNVTDLKHWKPPAEMYKMYPYYITGFDKEERPVFLWEFGKWKYAAMMSAGGEKAEIMEKYVMQTIQTLIELGQMFEKEGGVTVIIDLGDFEYSQIVNIPTALLFGRMARFGQFIEPVIDHAYLVNVAYAAQQSFNLFVPIIGSITGKMDFFGTTKERWTPVLLEAISKNQLPPWYGGSKDWKPVQVLGRGVPINQELLVEAQKRKND